MKVTPQDRQKLGFMFANGFNVQNGKTIIGKGLWLADLERWGFKKSQLKSLVDNGILLEITTRHPTDKGWRKTFVLPNGGEHEASQNPVDPAAATA